METMQDTMVSIIIPSYNRCDMLRGALESLVCQGTDGRFSFEIIVVDNGSTDNTREVFDEIARHHPSVPFRYVYEPAPSHPDALNRGVREARGKWMAFIDDDELAEKDWLLELVQTAGRRSAKVVGGPFCLNLRDLTEGELCSLGPVARKVLRDYKPYAVEQRFEGSNLPGSGNVMIAKEVFEAVGYFDNSIVTGMCDRDFDARAQAAGFDIWYNPKALVWHRVSKNRLSPRYFKWEQLKGGAQAARHDFKFGGRWKAIFFCCAKIAKTLLVNFPGLAYGVVAGNQRLVLDRKLSIWRMEGYARRTLSLIAPGIFAQRSFLSSIEIRKGRTDGINL